MKKNDDFKNDALTSTEKLIQQIKETNLFQSNNLKEIADRIEMFDRNYTFELKEEILNKEQVIRLNQLDKKYLSDKEIKEELIESIKDIASDYGISFESEDLEDENSL